MRKTSTPDAALTNDSAPPSTFGITLVGLVEAVLAELAPQRGAAHAEELGGFAKSLVEESESEATEGDSANLYALIQKMSVFQKIKLARLGNKEARGLLVKDRNKVVAISAISSPKITTNEVISIAQSRNVHDEVIRMVAMNRLWTRIKTGR